MSICSTGVYEKYGVRYQTLTLTDGAYALTVAPEKGVTGIHTGFGHVPAYLLKKGSSATWEASAETIAGFRLSGATKRWCVSVSSRSPTLRPTVQDAVARWCRSSPAHRLPARSIR